MPDQDEIKVRRVLNEIELVVTRAIAGTAEQLVALLEQTIVRIKAEDQDRTRERAEALIRDEPEVARAVAKILEESRMPASLIEGGSIVGATIVSPNYIGPLPGRSGVLSLDPSGDDVIVRLHQDKELFHIGRWDKESRELRLSMSGDNTGLTEVEQAVWAVCQARDVQRVRVLLPGGTRVILQRGGNVEHVAAAPGTRRYVFAKDRVIVPGEHTLYRLGVNVPSEAVQVAEAIMRGMYA